jgi:uncharacterized protein (TIGR00296 family)
LRHRRLLQGHALPPVTAEELSKLRLEISLLSAFEPLDDPHRIRIGIDGLMVEKSGRRGLLLPQVASHQGWDFETFLNQACLKAGLKAGDWKSGAHVQIFAARCSAREIPTDERPALLYLSSTKLPTMTFRME